MRKSAIIYFLIIISISCNSEINNRIEDQRTGHENEEERFADPISNDSISVVKTISKKLIISALYELNEALLNKDYRKAASFFIVPNEMSQQMLEKEVRNVIELQEISKLGVDILRDSSTFGTVEAIYGEMGIQKAEVSELDPAKCYGLEAYTMKEPTEVMCYWDGERVRFFRLDNVGKLGLP